MAENKKALLSESLIPDDIITQNLSYVKLFRSFLNWEWYTNANTMRVFIHCLLKANYQDKKWQGKIVAAGSFVTGRRKMAQELGMTEQQIRTAFSNLQSTHEITIKSYRQYSIISINNWQKFQVINQRINQNSTNKQPTDNQQITTTKEYKERKEIKKDILLHKISKEKFSNLDQEWILLIGKWLEYKKSKKQTYKSEQSLTAFIEKLIKLSSNNLEVAMQIIDESMANNWSGIFELKQNKVQQTNREEQTEYVYNPNL